MSLRHGRYTTYSNGKCRCSECRQAWAEYQREWQRRNPAKMRAKNGHRYHSMRDRALVLLGGQCQECDVTEDLVFDHIDPSTKALEMRDAFQRRKWADIEEELAKCQLLCQHHHGVKSAHEGWAKRKEHHGAAIF